MTITNGQAPSTATGPVLGATDVCATGHPYVTEPVAYDAILLAGFGGPEGQDDVIPFLRNVTAGRGIPEERLEEVATHYRHFGGISPINEHNRQLKAALEAELASRGIHLPVVWGNRNWAPYMKDAVSEANERGFRKLIAVATSAYSSFSSCRQYREDFAKALDETGLLGTVQIDKVRQFFDHPGFVAPFIEGVSAAMTELAEQGIGAAETHVLFATHSIPTTDAERSGPSDIDFGEGGAYAAQHRAVAAVVMAAQTLTADDATVVGAGVAGSLRDPLSSSAPWSLVYQSRSGPPSMPWLEPDINDAIAALDKNTVKAVIIVPLGFVSDHMEVMWDLDNEAMETAAENGFTAIRVPTPGVHRKYVTGLVDLVMERVTGTPVADRPALTELGPWYDVCRPGCCENVRAGFKPAAAGVAP